MDFYELVDKYHRALLDNTAALDELAAQGIERQTLELSQIGMVPEACVIEDRKVQKHALVLPLIGPDEQLRGIAITSTDRLYPYRIFGQGGLFCVGQITTWRLVVVMDCNPLAQLRYYQANGKHFQPVALYDGKKPTVDITEYAELLAPVREIALVNAMERLRYKTWYQVSNRVKRLDVCPTVKTYEQLAAHEA